MSSPTEDQRPVDADTAALLTALLAIGEAEAAAVREATPPRRRPSRQHGPVLDLGADAASPEEPGAP